MEVALVADGESVGVDGSVLQMEDEDEEFLECLDAAHFGDHQGGSRVSRLERDDVVILYHSFDQSWHEVADLLVGKNDIRPRWWLERYSRIVLDCHDADNLLVLVTIKQGLQNLHHGDSRVDEWHFSHLQQRLQERRWECLVELGGAILHADLK